jgi:hypothetical protein
MKSFCEVRRLVRHALGGEPVANQFIIGRPFTVTMPFERDEVEHTTLDEIAEDLRFEGWRDAGFVFLADEGTIVLHLQPV